MVVTVTPYKPENWCPVGRNMVQDYYVRREPPTEQKPYWGLVRDPDGNLRNRCSEEERQQWVADNQDMIEFIRSLKSPNGCRFINGPEKICDFGCGPGWLLRELPGWRRVGVEIDGVALTELEASAIEWQPSLVNVARGSCDVVVAYHVIEHLTDPISAIGAMREILKPGGWLILGTPDFGSPCAVRFGANYRLLHDPTHVSLFTCESMHRFLRDHMFTIRDVQFPFPERYATAETMARWNDTSKVSPPWPGNFVTFYCQRS